MRAREANPRETNTETVRRQSGECIDQPGALIYGDQPGALISKISKEAELVETCVTVRKLDG